MTTSLTTTFSDRCAGCNKLPHPALCGIKGIGNLCINCARKRIEKGEK